MGGFDGVSMISCCDEEKVSSLVTTRKLLVDPTTEASEINHPDKSVATGLKECKRAMQQYAFY